MQKQYSFILKAGGCMIASIIIGFLLLILVYLIPTERIRQNVAASSEQISEEGQYYQWATGYKNSQIDTYSDASLFLNAMHPSSCNPIADALNSSRILYGDDNNEESAVLLAREELGDTHVVNYGRYWHGSLIFLKPALFLFDLGDIRIFSMILQMGLLFLTLFGYMKRKLEKYLLGVFVAVIMINPVTMTLGFCFSVEYLLTLAVMCIILFFHEKLQVNMRYYFFFLLAGIFFVYFNELCFPMLGLGLPLITYLLISDEPVKEKLKKEVFFSALWGIGYVGMWIGKWVLAWVFTGYNYLKEAIGQAERYVSNHAKWEAENPTLWDRLFKNISMYLKWPYAVMGLAILVILLWFIWKKRKNVKRDDLLELLPYFVVSLLPFAIFIVLGNGYSYVHYWFTHRLLAISAFAGVCMLLQLGEKRKRAE